MQHLTNLIEEEISKLYSGLEQEDLKKWKQNKRVGPPAPTPEYSAWDLMNQRLIGLYLLEDGDEGKPTYEIQSNRDVPFILPASVLKKIP